MAATQGERLAALEQRMNDHESRCEERLAEIKRDGLATLKAVDSLKGRAWMVVFALLAWAGAQVWASNNSRFDRLEQRPAATATVNMPPATK